MDAKEVKEKAFSFYWSILEFDNELRILISYGDFPEEVMNTYIEVRAKLREYLEKRGLSLDLDGKRKV